MASLKNGVALRVVLGDLSWKLLPEPRDYSYAHFLGEELPHKDRENFMIEEVRCISLFGLILFLCVTFLVVYFRRVT